MQNSSRQLTIITLCSAITIFFSAFLIFLVEPLIAKKTVPWFGGSAAVWSICLVFYQTALLLGYLYSRVLTRFFRVQVQALIHVSLLTVSLLLLPIGPSARWKPVASDNPTWFILEMLTAVLALPFILLSATSPLLQDWLGRGGYRTPYRLFALSNFASLAALLAYPFLIEPAFDVPVQSLGWSVGYAAFALLCGFCAWSVAHGQLIPEKYRAVRGDLNISTQWYWFALAACGSMLLLAVTNHISENIAAVPLLWILPLAVYLLTFILAFSMERFYNRGVWMRFLALAIFLLAYAIYDIRSIRNIEISLTVFLFGLFVGCLFCHGELYRLRPPAEELTAFYLFMSLGGAVGAFFVGIVAPRIFNGIYELPFTLFILAALALALTWPTGTWPVRSVWIAITCCMIVLFFAYRRNFGAHAIYMNRSFYGSLRVLQSPHAGENETRSLYHGTIEHGAEFLLPPRRFQPTTYYGPDSGVGMLLDNSLFEHFQAQGPKRIGIIGLGVGTLAAYGKAGDTYRFYEINHQVVDVAESLFFYLRETKARIEIVEGDARLSLERDSSARFDVIAIDAFSGDAIPVHLLTREAFSMYRKHLSSADGILAFHVSNRYLELAPIVRQLADEAQCTATLIRNKKNDDASIAAADWVLVTPKNTVELSSAAKAKIVAIPSRRGKQPWTDSYNNLFEVLKEPNFRATE